MPFVHVKVQIPRLPEHHLIKTIFLGSFVFVLVFIVINENLRTSECNGMLHFMRKTKDQVTMFVFQWTCSQNLSMRLSRAQAE